MAEHFDPARVTRVLAESSYETFDPEEEDSLLEARSYIGTVNLWNIGTN
jgi:hypothetical protein